MTNKTNSVDILMSTDIILTDGIDAWGRGATQEAAIDDAVENCYRQTMDGGETYAAVTPEWIAGQLAIGEQSERRHGLWFEDAE